MSLLQSESPDPPDPNLRCATCGEADFDFDARGECMACRAKRASFTPTDDPPAPDDPPVPHNLHAPFSTRAEIAALEGSSPVAVVEGEIVAEPTMLIPTAAILQRMEGITAQDRALAVILGQRAMAITSIDDDDTEVVVGDLLDKLAAHQEHIGRKVRPFADLAFRLHRGLTGFLGQATQELTDGLAHLKPMLARRLKAKKDAEEARVREEREKARKAEQDRLLAEATHAESVGESPEVVQQIMREAEHVAAPPVAERPITAVKGAGTRDNWKAEVADKRALILHVGDRLSPVATVIDQKVLASYIVAHLDEVRFLADIANGLARIRPETHPPGVNLTAGDDSLLNLLVVDAMTATQLARAQKNTMKIPGLRAVNDVAFTKRRG